MFFAGSLLFTSTLVSNGQTYHTSIYSIIRCLYKILREDVSNFIPACITTAITDAVLRKVPTNLSLKLASGSLLASWLRSSPRRRRALKLTAAARMRRLASLMIASSHVLPLSFGSPSAAPPKTPASYDRRLAGVYLLILFQLAYSMMHALCIGKKKKTAPSEPATHSPRVRRDEWHESPDSKKMLHLLLTPH